jgi:hypothetical protein
MATRKRKLSELAQSKDDVNDATPVKKQKLERKESEVGSEKSNQLMRTASVSKIFENAYLPPEILVPILTTLHRADLARCSRVCQHWYQCSKDPLLGWMICEEFTLSNDEYRYTPYYGFNSSQSTTDLFPNVVPFHLTFSSMHKKIFRHDHSRVVFEIADAKGLKCKVKNSKPSGDAPYPDSNSDPKLWRLEITRDKSAKDYGQASWTSLLELNVRQFESQIYHGTTVKELPYILNLIKTEVFEQAEKQGKNFECKGTIIPNPDQEGLTPKGFTNKLSLHGYQQKAIGWMKSIEENKNKEFDFCHLVPWVKARSDLLFDLENNAAVTPDKFMNHVTHFKTNGAILADEMGMGKTIELIGLVLANPAGKLPKLDNYLPTKATLIICPNHLTAQWITEVNKSTKLKTVLLTTMKEVKEISYNDILEADVVVASMHLLKNPTYFALHAPGGKASMAADAPQKRALGWVLNSFESISKKKNLEKVSQPLLDHFHWHRIILDEGHEILKDSLLAGIIKHYSREFSWYVTGTPFPAPELFEPVKVYLGAKVDVVDSDNPAKVYSSWIENDLLVKNLLWRNTKQATTEYSVPDFNEDVVLLNFSPIETVLYDDTKVGSRHVKGSQEELQQLCCKLPENIGKTLNIIREEKLEAKRSMVSKLHDQVADTQRSIKYSEQQLERSREQEEKNKASKGPVQVAARLMLPEYYENQIQQMHQNLKSLWEEIAAQEEFFRRYAAAGVTHNNNKTNIQLEKPKGDEDAMVVEKEKEAESDTNTRRRGSNRASKKLAARAITENVLSENTSKKKRTPEEEKEFLINTLGTKLAHLITYLKDLFGKNKKARAIVFSKFPAYLEEIGDLLENHGIESAFVEGNIFRKNKALQSFKASNSKVKVILLSLEKAASGTNLVEASHVILMDPMSGSKTEVQAYESQAIGRAHRQGQKGEVTVVRLIIKNSVEHEMYLAAKEPEKPVSEVKTSRGLVRTSSLGTLVANMPQLRRSGSVANLLDKEIAQ